jgi:hypothetical protein
MLTFSLFLLVIILCTSHKLIHMSCLPGMPCYQNTVAVYTTYPAGCFPPVFQGYPIDSDHIIYTGPNLPCSGVSNNDFLTVALQKIDSKICPAQLVDTILSVLETDAVARARFCAIVSLCDVTTTTTSTTSTTTTLPPGVYAYDMRYSDVSGVDACAQTTSSIYYSNSPTLAPFSTVATNPALTSLAPSGHYCLVAGCPNPTNKQRVQVFGGVINATTSC